MHCIIRMVEIFCCIIVWMGVLLIAFVEFWFLLLVEYVYNGIHNDRTNPEQKRNMVQKYVCYYLEMFKHMPKTFYQIFSQNVIFMY